MSRVLPLLISVLSLFQATGCSSIMSRAFTIETANNTRKGREGPKMDYSGVYPGIRLVGDVLFNSEFPRKADPKGKLKAITPGVKSLVALVAVIDFPFSVPLDTVLLPFDALFYYLDSDPEEKKILSDSKAGAVASHRSPRGSQARAASRGSLDFTTQDSR